MKGMAEMRESIAVIDPIVDIIQTIYVHPISNENTIYGQRFRICRVLLGHRRQYKAFTTWGICQYTHSFGFGDS